MAVVFLYAITPNETEWRLAMRVARKWLVVVFFGLTAFVGLTAFSYPPVSATNVASSPINSAPTTQDLVPGAAADNQEPSLPDVGSEDYPQISEDWSTILSFFSSSGSFGVLAYGGYLIVKQWREGRAINVESYKSRALAAEERSTEAESRADELEKRLKSVRESARQAQNIAEEDKARYHDNLMALQLKARERLDLLHDNLDSSLIKNYELEKLLINNGIPVPDLDDKACPPGHTKPLSRTESAEALDTNEIDKL